MIPLRLSISGFLSYQNSVNIDFSNFHLACISGANGAGKSSILDAMTWVIFGAARSKNDAVINQKSTAAEVRLEFAYENQRYRIQRTKAVNKGQVLEFQVFDSDAASWRPITEHNITETQKRIESILRMDYDTFTNASFFLQGKADQFTQLPPGRRKEILSNILGLEIWEEYRIITREKRRVLEQTQQRKLSLIEEAEKELAEEPQIKQRLLQFQQELQEQLEQKALLNQLFEQAKQIQQSRTYLQQMIDSIKDTINKNERELSELDEQVENLITQNEKFESILTKESEIQKAYTEWKNLQQQLEELQNRSMLFYQLQQELNQAKQEIKNEETRLTTEYQNLHKDYQQIELTNTEIPLLSEKLIDLTQKSQSYQEKISRREEIQEQLEEAQNTFTTKRAEITQAELTLKNLRKRYHEFHQAGPECPFCNQPLTETHREQYETLLTQEGNQLKDLIQNLDHETELLQTQISQQRENLQQIHRTQQDLQNLTAQIATLQQQLQQKENLQIDWKQNKENYFQKVSNLLSTENFSISARETVNQVSEKITALHYDPLQHETIKVKESAARQSEIDFQELQIAKAKLETTTIQLRDLKKRRQKLLDGLAENRTQLALQEEMFSSQYENLPDLQQIESDLDQKQINISRLNQFMGAETQKLNFLENKQKQLRELRLENDQLTIRINRYKNLEDAFGKNGVPALLIEQSLPEIENHANDYLERLTNGNMSIKFQTQSEYKDKKRTDKKETLDILISDQSGHYRAYEMFSGGEAFRINFSIRLALSQVLTKRAGARLQTLVIDEGFGSQDVEGRQRLVEAINLVQKDFERILVITHLEELKEVFPTRIEVHKTTNGSMVEVIHR